MKKINLFVLLVSIGVIWASSARLSAQQGMVIREVEIVGNKKVQINKILKKIELKAGDLYDSEKISKDIENIYKLGSFDNIAIDLSEVEDGVKLTFVVKEKTVITRIDFKGNKEYSHSKLSKKIESEKGGFYDKYKLQEDTSKVIDFYKEKGFADIKVESYTSKVDESNEVVVTFFITEGNKIKIDKINIIGARSMSSKKIHKLLKIKKKKYYKGETLDANIEEVKRYYMNNGFLKIEIKEPLIVYNEDRTKIFISLFIYEGKKYSFKDVNFEGNKEYSISDLVSGLRLKTGSVFSLEKFDAFMVYIREKYAEKGYLRLIADPHYEFDDETDTVTVDIFLDENKIVYIDEVLLEGNYRTKDYVIKREFLVQSGDPFNITKIRNTQMKIFNLGFFSDVQVHIDDIEPYLAALVFEVEEQKTGIASLGAGYSYQDGFVGTVQISETNLMGRGQRLSLLWEFGSRRQSYQISFYEPWLFNKPYSFGTSLYNTLRDEEYALEDGGSVWTERLRRGGNLRLGKYFSKIYHVYLTYTLEQGRLDVPAAGLDDPYLKEEADMGLNTTSSITTTFDRDTRDNYFDPSLGSYYSLSVQSAGGIFGGSNDFIKIRELMSWHIPVVWSFVLSTQVRLGAVTGVGGSRVPTGEKFFVGGADTVRGYDYRVQIGPYEGGNLMFVGNLEYKFPIFREKMRTILQGALFFDIGGAWREFDDLNLNRGKDDDNLKASVGFGLRFHTPAFPIRLDWAHGLDHNEWEDKSQWHFTIGQVF